MRTAPPRRRSGRLAVVVESWPLVRMGLEVLLDEAGVAVVGRTDRGGEGVRLAAASEVDLLVLGAHDDLALDATLRRAKALSQGLRVLVLYGRVDRSEILGLLELGVDGLVPRLSPTAELQAAVGRVLAGERVVAGAAVAVLADAVVPASQPGGAAGPLTAQETRVLDRLVVGLSNAEIAVELSVSVATVKTHLSHLYGKLDARNRREAVAHGIDQGLVGLDRP